ncbi:FAD-dependent oxidoreductase [Streptomyces agglomeratus]|uniref:FAD-dependent monooxygenase n=1 Tax=Streptomyces agglomeratus TaxID=285458 RepID=UPI000854CB80|nr:FAD-dependent monooxygenase [Streptomyces agglomeratus]OEJ51126.1 FAD-dependent oxidoreductase [Streptomyces agglomeratus]OEJ58495.1 FAD-dependent oxidoreductase [Streptomyces agglomeratus]
MNGTITAPSQHTVVVVGAGPTGLLLAGDLAAAGIPVTVVERRPRGISNLTRAFGVHARTLEQLDARGLADDLILTGRAVTRLRLFGSLSLDLSNLPSRFPYLLVSPQYEVEKLLLRRAEENGATFVYGTEVTGVAQDATGVTLDVRRENGTAGSLRAAYAVGTDGVRSAVREALGLPFPGRSAIKSIVLADVLLAEEPDGAVAINGMGTAFGFLIPFGDGHWRVGGWDRTRGATPDSAPVELEELRDITRRAFGSDFGMHDPRWMSRFHSDERQVPRYRVGRVLLAGDAAHTHSPAGGQGMNTGLEDAANLSWKLAAVASGRAPEGLLDSYHDERHPVGKSVLRSSGALLRLSMAHTPLQRGLRTLLTTAADRVGPVTRGAVGRITGLGYAYGAPRGAHPLTGKRVPDVELREGRLYERLRDGKFVLVTPRGTQIDHDEWLTVAHWASDRRTTLLVRPDGYAAWASEEDQAGSVTARLGGGAVRISWNRLAPAPIPRA